MPAKTAFRQVGQHGKPIIRLRQVWKLALRQRSVWHGATGIGHPEGKAVVGCPKINLDRAGAAGIGVFNNVVQHLGQHKFDRATICVPKDADRRRGYQPAKGLPHFCRISRKAHFERLSPGCGVKHWRHGQLPPQAWDGS